MRLPVTVDTLASPNHPGHDIPDSELGRHGQPRLIPMPWPELPAVSMMGNQQLPGRAEASLLMFSIDRPLENSSCNSDARI